MPRFPPGQPKSFQEQPRPYLKMLADPADVRGAELARAAKDRRAQGSIPEQAAEIRTVHAATVHEVLERLDRVQPGRLNGSGSGLVVLHKDRHRLEVFGLTLSQRV